MPFAGYGFYGAANSEETAAFYCSYGLLSSAPTPALHLWREQGILALLL